MIKLRELKEKDAIYMLEWMHDPDTQQWFKKRMIDYTLEDALNFINNSKMHNRISTGDNLHFAIVNEEDEYLGTISLKNIDIENKSAEFAITTRKKAQGKNISSMATDHLLRKAFYEMNLNRVYLSVFSTNNVAINFYEKKGFKYEGEFRKHFFINDTYINWKWYGMLKDEFEANDSI